jgi:hypothetical protein
VLLNPLSDLSTQDIPSLYLFVTIATNKSDLYESDAFLIPFPIATAMGRPDVVALIAPSVGMRVSRIIAGKKSLALSVQQIVTNKRFSPITVSVAVDRSVLVGSRFS